MTKTKYTLEVEKSGDYTAISYFQNEKLHDFEGIPELLIAGAPAYHLSSPKMEEYRHYQHGKLHCVDGPARWGRLYSESDKTWLTFQDFYVDGICCKTELEYHDAVARYYGLDFSDIREQDRLDKLQEESNNLNNCTNVDELEDVIVKHIEAVFEGTRAAIMPIVNGVRDLFRSR